MIGDWHHRTPVSAFRWAIMRGYHRLTISSSRRREGSRRKVGLAVDLTTVEGAARFIGHMRPWRQVWPHRNYAAAFVLKAATIDLIRPGPRSTDRPVPHRRWPS